MTFEFRTQVGGPWQTARGFLVRQLQSFISQLAPIQPMLNFSVPYPANSTLVTDGLGNPSFGQPQPTPVAITAAQTFYYTLNVQENYRNWNPPNWDSVLGLVLTTPVNITIQSLTAPGVLTGVFKTVVNRGPNTLTLPYLDTSTLSGVTSQSGNQFYTPGLVNYVMAAGSAVQIWYDVTNRIWQIVDKV